MAKLSARASRILQGGLPLQAVFDALIGYMLANGRSAQGIALVKVVRDKLENLHEARVMTGWGSWEHLTFDLVEELETRGLLERTQGSNLWSAAEDTWTLTYRVFEGARIRYIGDIRGTVYSPEASARREALAYARLRAGVYRDFLKERGIYKGQVRETFERHWSAIEWDDIPSEEEEGKPRARRGELTTFLYAYFKSRPGEWTTSRQAGEAFKETRITLTSLGGTVSNRLRQLEREGVLSSRMGEKAPGAPGPTPREFSWNGE